MILLRGNILLTLVQHALADDEQVKLMPASSGRLVPAISIGSHLHFPSDDHCSAAGNWMMFAEMVTSIEERVPPSLRAASDALNARIGGKELHGGAKLAA